MYVVRTTERPRFVFPKYRISRMENRFLAGLPYGQIRQEEIVSALFRSKLPRPVLRYITETTFYSRA